MRWIDLTLPTPQENLACDEVLLDLCEDGLEENLLRFWEPRQYFIALGYSNKANSHARLELCRERGIPILRRVTGGGTVLQGPGCLNVSLVFRFENDPHHASTTATNRYVLERQRTLLEKALGRRVSILGSTDLTLGALKFSGNAQRRKRRAALFHGSLLVSLDLDLVETLLPPPPVEPEYRKNRAHRDFLKNLETDPELLKEALRAGWGAEAPLTGIPLDTVRRLAEHKYSDPGWNFRF